jgi:hypothetical protein
MPLTFIVIGGNISPCPGLCFLRSQEFAGSEICCQYIIGYETHTKRAVGKQSGDAVILHFFYQENEGKPGKYEGKNDVNNISHDRNPGIVDWGLRSGQ